jgi:hypothetical protein
MTNAWPSSGGRKKKNEQSPGGRITATTALQNNNKLNNISKARNVIKMAIKKLKTDV